MHEFLPKMIGRKVDIFCGGAARFRGEAVKIEGGVLHLKDEDGTVSYVAVDKISVIREARRGEHRAGFLPVAPNDR